MEVLRLTPFFTWGLTIVAFLATIIEHRKLLQGDRGAVMRHWLLTYRSAFRYYVIVSFLAVIAVLIVWAMENHRALFSVVVSISESLIIMEEHRPLFNEVVKVLIVGVYFPTKLLVLHWLFVGHSLSHPQSQH
jgi:hypothetical protein